MHLPDSRRNQPRLLAAITVALLATTYSVGHAAILNYHANLNGTSEAPPNASPGIGTAEVTIDNVANTMRVQANFAGLLGNTTACHIHGPTAVAGTGTAGVTTMTPAFTGFPLGVNAGFMDHTFDLTLTATYNGPFVTANGGTAAGAEAALLAAIAAGKAYFNIHTTTVPGGEIRGFLAPFDPVPAKMSSWGRIKGLYK